MDNPFLGDNKANPFQTPYQQPAPGAAPGIKPFAAVDLAPPIEPTGARHGGPASPSPFAGSDFSNAFLAREAAAAGTMPPAPAPAAPKAAAPIPAVPAPVTPAFPAAPAVPKPMKDFSPAPMAPPAAARQSQILSMTDFNEALEMRKPEFFCTSTPAVDGYQVRKYLGVVSVELVVPKDVLFHHPAPHGELHRIKSAEEQLQKVKLKAIEELSDRAKGMQADGVVGVTLSFAQLDAVVCLCSAVGTAVQLAD
jgi:uncharacterized protein YbjQ (UPF0145 family)